MQNPPKPNSQKETTMGEFHASLQSTTPFRTPIFLRILAGAILVSALAWGAWADSEAKDAPRAAMCAELGRKLELGKLAPVSIFAAAFYPEARFDCADKHGDRWNAAEYGLTYSGATGSTNSGL